MTFKVAETIPMTPEKIDGAGEDRWGRKRTIELLVATWQQNLELARNKHIVVVRDA